MRRSTHSFIGVAIGLAATLAASPAHAQLDPLLFLKNQAPNVILVVEATNRMERDADLAYYDMHDYSTDTAWSLSLGLMPGEYSDNNKHRRKYIGLTSVTPGMSGDPKFDTVHIDAVGDAEAGYKTFYERTRFAIARRALIQAINDNINSARFSLVKTRQTLESNPLPSSPNEDTTIQDLAQAAATDDSAGKWKLTRPEVRGKNYLSAQSSAWVTRIGDNNATSTILSTLAKNFTDSGALVPAGADTAADTDTPVGLMLEDAKAEATRLIGLDTSGCRNTVVVLVVGGSEGQVSGAPSIDLANKAREFLNVSGRRVPIYVIAIAPRSDDVDVLKAIARNSGGEYVEVTKSLIEATLSGPFYTFRQPVPEAVRGINRAIQHAFINSTAFNTAPTNALPTGPQEEFQVTSPIIGTVNLKGAQAYDPVTGDLITLPDSETEIFHNSNLVPQRSNVLVTSAFALPGFEARLRALRVYKPVEDSTRPSGFKFVADGSRLWTASTPDPASRNIYTILPGSAEMIKFDAAHVTDLSPYLRVNDPGTLIDWVRARPLGAVIGSTPAFLDPPSLDPPPDAEYPAFRDENKTRRSLVFVGLNDGMLHAIDSRTGVEVWAFVPFNLLPKLRALRSGQSLDAFKYFMDSSAKIADIRVAGEWKTYLFIGQGPGGTFYNALDVTLDGMASAVSDIAPIGEVLNYFSNATRIRREWGFPRDTNFDVTIGSAAAPFGDLSVSASLYEKTVGETWSDPAIGQVGNETGPYVMLVGSGFMKRSMEMQANRNNGAINGGRNFYVLDAATGNLLATRDVGADNQGESDDNCRTANNCSRLKNALQMDPVATGVSDSRFISRVYIGDLDGNVWRFDIALSGSSVQLAAPTKLYSVGVDQPIFSSMATVNVGGSKQYIFVGTGSDLLPSNGVNSSYKMMVLLDNGSSASLTAEILLEKTDGLAGDEKVTAFPAVAGDIVFFTTTTTIPAQVCSPFYANLYAFTFIGGPAYDTNQDGRFSTNTTTTTKQSNSASKRNNNNNTANDDELVTSIAGARATAPFIVDQHLVFSAGGNIEMFGDPNDFNNGVGQAGVRILSWRLVR